jgi:hypothetical protein
MPLGQKTLRDSDRIDLTHDYALCAWARLFNVSEKQVREAVSQVGDRAMAVKAHLQRGKRAASNSDRPSGH